jgi:hypothetical protein
VIARSPTRLQDIAQQAEKMGNTIHPISLDYQDSESLQEKIEAARQTYGNFHNAICWIHSVAPKAHSIIIKFLESCSVPCSYFHIMGSSNIQALKDSTTSEFTQGLRTVVYHRIVLGAIYQGSSFRWLTHEEIASGVMTAVESRSKYYVVGTLE